MPVYKVVYSRESAWSFLLICAFVNHVSGGPGKVPDKITSLEGGEGRILDLLRE